MANKFSFKLKHLLTYSRGWLLVWSLIFVAVAWFGFNLINTLRGIGTERVNRFTEIALNGSEATLTLALPKGMWMVDINSEQSVKSITYAGESKSYRVTESGGNKQLTLYTDKDFTTVIIQLQFTQNPERFAAKVRATF